jgi:hypothetical protein
MGNSIVSMSNASASPYVLALKDTYSKFESQENYRAKLVFLKKQNLNSSDIDFIRKQVQDSIFGSNFQPQNMIDSLLVIAKLSREPKYFGTKLKNKKADKESLAQIKRVLMAYLPNQELEANLETTLKRIASLRTIAAKRFLKILAEDFNHGRSLSMTKDDARYSKLAQDLANKMQISVTGSGFNGHKSLNRRVMESMLRFNASEVKQQSA